MATCNKEAQPQIKSFVHYIVDGVDMGPCNDKNKAQRLRHLEGVELKPMIKKVVKKPKVKKEKQKDKQVALFDSTIPTIRPYAG